MSQRIGAAARMAATVAATVVATEDVAGQIPAETLQTPRLFGVSQCLHLEKS